MCTDPGVGGKGYTEKPGLLRLDLRLRRDESTQAACLNLVNHELYYELSPKSGAFLHTLRWNCVAATDPNLFQAPSRAGIKIDAYQMGPLRNARA